MEMEQSLKDSSEYEEIDIIGNGAYGTVYKAKDLANTGQMVALKKIRIPLNEDGVPMAILREISLLKQLEKFDHPNVVKLLDVCYGKRGEREQILILVFEHVDQDLASYLESSPNGLSSSAIRILSGVEFLHSQRIVHRDLKPQNLLITNDGKVKLADFGLSRIYDFQMILTSVVVTLWYRPPEVLLGTKYSTPVDIWSCGCIFAELFRRKALFCGQSELDQLSKIFQIIGRPVDKDWPANASIPRSSFQNSIAFPLRSVIPGMDENAEDLLQKMLVFNPEERITAKEALLHIYFTNYDYFPIDIIPNRNVSISVPTSSMKSTKNFLE